MARKKKEETTEEIVKEKAIGPFQIINMMLYRNEAEFNALPDDILAKNYFIINDRLSIQFPMQAAVFNHYKINPAQVVKCWYRFIASSSIRGYQEWLKVKGKAKTSEEKKENNILDKKLIKQYAYAQNYSVREIEFALEIFGDAVKNEIIEYDEHLKEMEKIRKSALASLKAEDEEDTLTEDYEHQTAMF